MFFFSSSFIPPYPTQHLDIGTLDSSMHTFKIPENVSAQNISLFYFKFWRFSDGVNISECKMSGQQPRLPPGISLQR